MAYHERKDWKLGNGKHYQIMSLTLGLLKLSTKGATRNRVSAAIVRNSRSKK